MARWYHRSVPRCEERLAGKHVAECHVLESPYNVRICLLLQKSIGLTHYWIFIVPAVRIVLVGYFDGSQAIQNLICPARFLLSGGTDRKCPASCLLLRSTIRRIRDIAQLAFPFPDREWSGVGYNISFQTLVTLVLSSRWLTMPRSLRSLSSITRARAARINALLASSPRWLRRAASRSWHNFSSWNELFCTSRLTCVAVVAAYECLFTILLGGSRVSIVGLLVSSLLVCLAG